MQATIEGLLTAEPITAQEIADKPGATVAVVRLAITTLEHKGKVISVGLRPVRFCAPAKPAKILDHGDYHAQLSTRYFRPGSYTPPSEKTFTLPGMGDAVVEQGNVVAIEPGAGSGHHRPQDCRKRLRIWRREWDEQRPVKTHSQRIERHRFCRIRRLWVCWNSRSA